MSASIRVLVADDHPMFREAVKRALARRTKVVAETEDGRETVRAITSLRPDVAVVDLKMPALDGLGVLGEVVEHDLPTRVILLSGAMEDEDVYAALQHGAAGVLPKTVPGDRVVAAVFAVANGGTVLATELQPAVARQIRLRSGTDDDQTISPREREILSCVADGLTNPEIAKRLVVSPSTVKSHLEKLYSKLGARDRGSAVATGLRQGLIE